MSFSWTEIAEIVAVISGLIYVWLMIKENIWCWFFGILGSAISISVFIDAGLYSEAILYTYYVAIGIYGYHSWTTRDKKGEVLHISEYKWNQHLIGLTVSVGLAWTLGYIFDTYTDASSPYLDAHTTIFSFFASYLEARKILSAWLYWLVINTVTIFLYLREDLNYYIALSVVYLVFSVIGYINWRKKMLEHTTQVAKV